jgi:PilZ domain
VTYVSGEIVGLRGPMGANDVFSPRDLVTLHVRGDRIVFESHARVLATGGHTMRILTERGLVAAERRAAPRIHASPFVMLTPLDGSARTPQAAQLVDLSVVGCAIRSDCRLEVGSHVALAAAGRHGSVRLAGEIVRVWRAEPTAWFHAAIRFEPMTAAEQGALERFLVEYIRAYDQAG